MEQARLIEKFESSLNGALGNAVPPIVGYVGVGGEEMEIWGLVNS